MRLAVSKRLILTGGVLASLLMAGPSPTLQAQAPAGAGVARDADVLGAERLFSAWLEGQMLYRHLPGIAVGVVADQELIWAAGFGFADTGKKTPMTPQTKFRMASHSKLFTATADHAAARAGEAAARRSGVEIPPVVPGEVGGPEDPPITIEELLTHSSGLAARSGLALDHLRIPDHASNCAS